eukprot:scaffold305516_cov22-Tisochrysis_lutea.AAC.1
MLPQCAWDLCLPTLPRSACALPTLPQCAWALRHSLSCSEEPALLDPALTGPALADPALADPGLAEPALANLALVVPASLHLTGPQSCATRHANPHFPALLSSFCPAAARTHTQQ